MSLSVLIRSMFPSVLVVHVGDDVATVRSRLPIVTREFLMLGFVARVSVAG